MSWEKKRSRYQQKAHNHNNKEEPAIQEHHKSETDAHISAGAYLL
jgi:hypothetical protein